jgi:hypothetical protein
MIDHVHISVTEVEKSLAFYAEALKPLGWTLFGNYDAASGPEGVPDLPPSRSPGECGPP